MHRIHLLLQKGNLQMRILAAIIIFLIFGSLNSMELIDSQGCHVTLSDKQKEIFLASDVGMQLKDDIAAEKMVDLSAMGHVNAPAKSVLKVLAYAGNPKLLTSQQFKPEEADLLETANFLGVAQKEVLYHLANRVWPHLSKYVTALEKKEHEKAFLRKIAKPYVNSPGKLTLSSMAIFYFEKKEQGSFLDLSFKVLRKDYEQVYPFGSTEGLPDLIRNLVWSADRTLTNIEIDLSGHSIQEFVLDDWMSMESRKKNDQLASIRLSINLTNNGIERIAWSRLPTIGSTKLVNFSHNPIAEIDSSIYDLIHKYRSRGESFMLQIPRDKLSDEQIAQLKANWYLASNTLVDRYFKDHNPDGISIIAGLFAVAAGGLADVVAHSNGALLVGGLGGGVCTWFMLNHKLLPKLAHRLALKTHPDIERPTFFSHEKPFGNTWLHDYEKPQLVLS